MMNHEKIVKLYNYTENDYGIFLHMEYCNDPTFFVDNIEVTMQPFVDESWLKWFGKDIIDALNYVHDKNVIHGDVKI